MRKLAVSLGVVLMITLTIAAEAVGQNAAIQWDGIAATTIISNGGYAANISKTAPGAITAGGAGLYLAFVHLAMYNAVNAIEGGYQPYHSQIVAPAGSSSEAAAASAAYYVLLSYFPDQQASLDAQFAASLAAIPAGSARDNGVLVGKAAALEIVALRSNDGRGANVPYSYPLVPTPGVWIPVPINSLPQTPWVGQMKPLVMSTSSQFLPEEGPTPLGSDEWTEDFNLTKSLGSINSTVRTPQQTEVGLFWIEHTAQQYARAFRGLAAQRNLSLPESSRLFAMLWTSYADGFIGCMNAKYHFSFWRPITAIRNAEIDGNPDTIADPTWTPLGTTPTHPEFPAAHGCVTGAVADTLASYFGSPIYDFSVSSTVTNTVHQFHSAQELKTEVKWARIYAGFHYRNSVNQGTVLGQKVANLVTRTNFQPVRAAH